MIKNALLVFLRKLRKNDIYSLINLMGLSIGITACLLIFLYVADEWRYDRHHEYAQQTHRLLIENIRSGNATAIHTGAMYPYLDGQITGVEKMARLYHWSQTVINAGEEPMIETGYMAADATILDIFSFTFIHGDPSTALDNPHAIIITPETAIKYFGQEDPIGKTLDYQNAYSFVVSGVVEPFPDQSHIQFNMIASLESMQSVNPSILNNWNNQGLMYYLRLKPGADPDVVAENITHTIRRANERLPETISYRLQPLTDIRLRSTNIDWDIANTNDITIVRIFSMIAILILALACFNFINLSVAMAVKRAREIGIKKVLGAGRWKLIGQFIAETFILALVAFVIANLLVEVALPFLNTLTGKSLSLQLLREPSHLAFAFALLLIISLIAGGYPALVISRFKALHAMRGIDMVADLRKSRKKKLQFRMRQFLMLLQFAVSTALIVASLMIFLQMRFLSDRHPGYDQQNMISIQNPWDEHSAARATWLKNQLLQQPDVLHVSLAHNIPPGSPNNHTQYEIERSDGPFRIHGAVISCDASYFTTLGSNIIKGRDFYDDTGTDPDYVTIINTTMMNRLGVDDPLGMQLSGFYDGNARRIVGVVKDIHFMSLHEPVGPMAFYINENSYPQNWFNLAVRFNDGASTRVLSLLEGLWQEEAPQWPLQFNFVDQLYKDHYDEDRRTMFIVTSFAALAVVLSLLGLIGLALYAAATRTKEIGIRKVAGASSLEITRMITSEFGALVIISNIIAWPAAWYFTNRWLENFAYRIDTQWLAFLIPALVVLALASLTVGIIAYRTANLNPVDTLRNTE